MMDSCPLDLYGQFVSFNRWHNNFDYAFDFPASKDACRETLTKIHGPDIVFLGYYEHSGCVWFVEGEGGPGTNCRFDGVSFAGYWVPHKGSKHALQYRYKLRVGTPERHAKVLAWARTDCEDYTKWCNGETEEE